MTDEKPKPKLPDAFVIGFFVILIAAFVIAIKITPAGSTGADISGTIEMVFYLLLAGLFVLALVAGLIRKLFKK